jgi:hypothetical protein
MIEFVTGLKGAYNKQESTFKVSKARDDVLINVDQNSLPPFMGLTSWATFMVGGRAEAMVMGDMVLFEDEVNPVMSAAFENGLEVSALHNHFFFDHPKVYFMQIGGEGKLQTVLKTLRNNQINIVAIHQHMTGETPQLMFLHYYGRGKALDLARGVKAALDTQPRVLDDDD